MNGGIVLSGTFARREEVLTAARLARERGYRVVDLFSPYPVAEFDEIVGARRSPVRYFTLGGGLLGFAAGFALTVSVALRHGIITGGKPVIAIPPFVIIAFEVTVLLGALATMAGFLLRARLPKIYRGGLDVEGHAGETFRLTIACGSAEAPRLKDFLKEVGAREVRDEAT